MTEKKRTFWNFADSLKGDKVVWMIFFFLCMISIVEVYSASSELTYKSGSFSGPILKHVGMLIGGLVVMVVTLNIPCRFFKVLTPFLLPISFLMLIYVLVMGEATNGAQRWISILGIQFQPSEIAKGAVILAVAQILSFMQTEHGADKRAFKYIIIVCLFFIPLILLENLSTAALLSAVVFMMMIIGRIPANLLGKLIAIVVISLLLIVGMVMLLGKESPEPTQETTAYVEASTQEAAAEETGAFGKLFHRFGTWKSRFKNHFGKDDTVDPKTYDWDKDGQKGHANIAIASCGIIGKGPGNSVERDWLPQAFSDFIYAIIIEEKGLLIAAIPIFLLYAWFYFRCIRIATHCHGLFGRLCVAGIGTLLYLQAIVNMSVAVGLLPVTGQTLPFISFGGSAYIFLGLGIGVIQAVASDNKKQKLKEEKIINEVNEVVKL